MLSHMLLNFLQNRNTVFFAINNLCNCKCEMCSIWNSNNKKIVNFKSAKKALIKLKENNFGYLQITGGEPLLNPNLFKIIFFAKKIGFVVSLTTNGTLIDEITAKKLAETKIDNISISFHHYDEKIFESISNHKNILDKVTKAIKLLKRENIFVIALFTISKYNKYDIEKTVKFINNKGIGVSFCMPIIKTKTSFSLGGDCASLSSEELRKVILEIISLKKKGFKIINNIIFFEEILRFLEGKNKYYCFGGKKLFYLDWNLNVYPCMFKGNSQKIYNFNFDFNDDICNECLLQCFREPSIFLISQPIASISFLKEFKTYLALYHKNLLLIQYLKHLHTVLKKIYQ